LAKKQEDERFEREEKRRLEKERLQKEKEDEERKSSTENRAAELDKQANEAVAEGIANRIAEDLAQKKIDESREAEQAAKEQQETQVMESFKGMGAKLRFREALAHGNMDMARDAGANMLQGAWRAKIARRKMEAKRAEKQRLLEEGYVRKIQCRYRARLAHKRVEELRAERLRVLQAATKPVQIEEVNVQSSGVPAMKVGYLQKEGHVRKNWKIRYFVLMADDSGGSTLKYYVKEKSTPPYGESEKGSLNLKGCTVNVENVYAVLTTDGKSLKVKFSGAEDRHSWMSAIEQHIQYAS